MFSLWVRLEPAFWLVGVWVWVIFRVVVQGVCADGYVCPAGNNVAVDDERSGVVWRLLMPEIAGYGRRYSEGFVDTCPQIFTVGELWALSDLTGV